MHWFNAVSSCRDSKLQSDCTGFIDNSHAGIEMVCKDSVRKKVHTRYRSGPGHKPSIRICR